MDWQEYFRLGAPLTTGQAFFLVWFWGAVAGYCFGRAHAAWITMRKLFDRVDARLDKGTK